MGRKKNEGLAALDSKTLLTKGWGTKNPRMLFESLSDFREFINGVTNRIPLVKKYWDTRITADLDGSIKRGWYGNAKNVDKKDLTNRSITKFQYLELLENLEGKIDFALSTDSATSIEKRKLQFNDLGLGVFTFDRVAQGMFRLNEFYSPKHDAVFDKAQVQEIGKGYELKSDRSEIVERKEQWPSGKPKIRTTQKKVFAWFPKVKKEQRSVTIVTCPFHPGFTKGEDTVYSGVTTLIVAKKLITAGIKVRIILAIAANCAENTRSDVAAYIEVKKYEQPLDANLLGIVSSDPRFCRYEGIFALHALFILADNKPSIGVGIPLNTEKLAIVTHEFFKEQSYFGEEKGKFLFHNQINSEQAAIAQIKADFKYLES